MNQNRLKIWIDLSSKLFNHFPVIKQNATYLPAKWSTWESSTSYRSSSWSCAISLQKHTHSATDERPATANNLPHCWTLKMYRYQQTTVGPSDKSSLCSGHCCGCWLSLQQCLLLLKVWCVTATNIWKHSSSVQIVQLAGTPVNVSWCDRLSDRVGETESVPVYNYRTMWSGFIIVQRKSW